MTSLSEHRERALGSEAYRLSPEGELAQSELVQVLDTAIAGLPEEFRMVLVLRDIEGIPLADVADVLQIPVATVKSRAFRAQRMLRNEIEQKFGPALAGAVQFAGENCARMAERVLGALASS